MVYRASVSNADKKVIEKIHGVVLGVIRHNDRNNIVTLYTAERGRISFLSSAAGGKSGRMRRARLSPLAMVESDVNFRESRELQYLGAVEVVAPWRELYFDPMKAPIVIFISEFLNKLLRTSGPDPAMWAFVTRSLAALDCARRGLANYHLAFLIRMLPIVGIAPDTIPWQRGDLFDMRTAEFTPLPPGHSDILPADESAAIATLMRINYRNMHLFRFNVGQRRRLLNVLLHYYSLHLPMPSQLKSVEVLSELF